MEQVGKNLAAELKGVYNAMRAAYGQADNKEQGAEAALQIFRENDALLYEVQAAMDEIMDFKELLEKGLEALREQRAKREARAVTMRGHGTTVVKLVPCGKHCSGCPHGPYAYRVTKVNGKQVWEYLGKA